MTEHKKIIKEYLINNYSIKPKEDIVKDLGLSWNYIQKLCHLFNIKRDFNESMCSFSLNKMLNFDNISCYWFGFLLADGHIKDNLQINLSIKDKDHILKMINYYDIKNAKIYESNNIIRVSVADNISLNKIKKIFNWNSNKTKNPPTIPDLNDDQLFSLIIGFIDGDGSINKSKGNLRIKCDLSWNNILQKFYTHLTNEIKEFKPTTDRCSIICINKFDIVRNIKKRSLHLNLPIMNRKWDYVNIDRILKKDKYSEVESMILNKKTKEEIISKYSQSLYYKVKSKLENKLNEKN